MRRRVTLKLGGAPGAKRLVDVGGTGSGSHGSQRAGAVPALQRNNSTFNQNGKGMSVSEQQGGQGLAHAPSQEQFHLQQHGLAQG